MDILQHGGSDQRAGEDLNRIRDPVQRYAIRMQLTTHCTPEIAAAAAVIHYRIHDPEGNFTKAIAGAVTNELKRMNAGKDKS